MKLSCIVRRQMECENMSRTVGIGIQSFEKLIENDYFYIDKTDFIRQWWESGDDVTLITRPRRFGKTLNMNMLERFFSAEYAGQGRVFERLSIWKEEKYRELQGTYPVIMLSFANVKETTYGNAFKKLCYIIAELYNRFDFLLKDGILNESEKEYYRKVTVDMEAYTATDALKAMSGYLTKYYGKKVIILLDEYDTPMQEAYVNGYWEEMVSFTRSLFNATFKTNPYLERAVMTGITRVSKESMFSDLNNLQAVSVTSERYRDSFGFTEEEVFAALDEFSLSDRRAEVKQWYDGFVFGGRADIYNPWSIINYLDIKKAGPYWANTSSNTLAGKLIREGRPEVKMVMEQLMQGKSFLAEIDEQIVYDQLEQDNQAIWSLFLACGYLTAKRIEPQMEEFGGLTYMYELAIMNMEVRFMFRGIIRKWFGRASYVYNDFIKAMLTDDVRAMNVYMNKVALATFSYFRKSNEPKSSLLEFGDCLRVSSEAADIDTGINPSEQEPERFYQGFVLGLMMELSDRYILTSNRESGFGRYDVMLEPKHPEEDDAVIMEFKVQDPGEERELVDTVKAALRQIEEKRYDTLLMEKGIAKDKIRKYGFAFCGKKVLIGS